MGPPRPGRVARLELPPPQVPRRRLPWLGRRPGDPAAFLELHHVVLPDLTPGQRHRENVTGAPDALPGRRAGQVVVAVPARLRRRIRDQLEDLRRPGRDLPGGADHPWRVLLSCHVPHLPLPVTSRTIFPPACPASRIRCASAAASRGSTWLMTGRNSRRSSRSASARVRSPSSWMSTP